MPPIVPLFVQILNNGRMAAHCAANCAAIRPDLNKMDEWRHVWRHIFSDWQHLIFKVLCAANCAAMRPELNKMDEWRQTYN